MLDTNLAIIRCSLLVQINKGHSHLPTSKMQHQVQVEMLQITKRLSYQSNKLIEIS